MFGLIGRLIISSLRSVIPYVIPEVVRYCASKFVNKLKKKRKENE